MIRLSVLCIFSGIFIGAPLSADDVLTTRAMVTSVKGAAFNVKSSGGEPLVLRPGHGVLVGDRVWVEPGTMVRFVDTKGGVVTAVGPTALGFLETGRVRLYHGFVKLEGSSFEHVRVIGEANGEFAVWATRTQVQMLGLSGDVRVWHPKLSDWIVSVAPGYFSETNDNSGQLPPERPVPVDEKEFKKFMAKFGEGSRELPEEEEEPHRELAAAVVPEKGAPITFERKAWGSRLPDDVNEKADPKISLMIKARFAGLDWDDDGGKAGKAPFGGGRKIASNAPGAKKAAPKVQLVPVGGKLSEEQKKLLLLLNGGKAPVRKGHVGPKKMDVWE
jgi:hypothetical protein